MTIVSQVMRQVATEAIDYQYNAVLFNDLTAKISEIRETVGSGTLTNKILDNAGISTLINRHTGLNLTLECDKTNMENAWVFIPEINRNNPILSPDSAIWTSEKDLKNAARNKGFVDAQIDLVKGQVGGYYSRLATTAVVTTGLFMGKDGVGYRYTSEEVAAIILHELGHLFTFLESMVHVFRRNWILQSRVKDYLEAGDNKTEKIRIVTDMKKAGIIDEDDVDVNTIIDAGDKGVCLIVTNSYKKIYQDTAVAYHDNTAFESASDQFAVRMGAGRHLASALIKLGGNSSKFMYYLGIFSQIFFLTITVVGTILGYINPLVGLFVGFVLAMNGFLENSFVYDTMVDRLNRIRDEMITPLKKSDLPDEMKKSLLKQYDELEKACKKSPFYKEYPDHKGFFGWVASYVFPSLNKNRKSKEYQQLIESLQNNSLYAASARF